MILKYKVDKLPFLFYNTCKVGDIMYLYRAVNDWDIYFNMINNGFVSKEIIDDFFKNFGSMDSEYNFSVIEKHQKEILNIAGFYQEYVNSLFSSIENKKWSLIQLISSANSHVLKGSSINYNWISFSKDIFSIKKYYLEQKNYNYIAIIESSNETFEEHNGDYLIKADYSTIANMQENEYLMTQMGEKIAENSRLAAYGINSKEVCFYGHVPQDRIVAILRALEADMILRGIISLREILSLSNFERLNLLMSITSYLKTIYQNDELALYIINEHYINNRSILSISEGCQDIEKFNQTFFSIIDSISSIIVNENQVQKLKLCNYQ